MAALCATLALQGGNRDRARRPSPIPSARWLRTFGSFPRRPGGGDHDGMTAIATSYESLLKVRKGAVSIVDVPEFGFVAVTGTGEPGGAEFTEAVQALCSVGYGAHFRLKKLTGEVPRVIPLEGLWTTRPGRTSSPRRRGARSPWPAAIGAAGSGRR